MNRAKAILTACFQPIVNTFKEKHFMKIHPIYPHLLGWLLYGTLSTLLTPNTGFAQTAYVRSDHVNAVPPVERQLALRRPDANDGRALDDRRNIC
jgi:hypothetical protein